MNLSKAELDTILDAMERGIDNINEAVEDPIYSEQERAELMEQKSAILRLSARVMAERNTIEEQK